MGCGSSKLNAVEEEVPEKIRPLLLRRFEEIKKRKQRTGAPIQRETTLSKKKLLTEEEDANSDSSIKAEVVCKPPSVTSPGKVEPTKVVPLPDSDSECETFVDAAENHNGNTEQATPQEKEIDAEDKVTQEVVAENEHEEVVDEKNDDGDDFAFGRFVCPGSPSFRIYCVPSQNDKEETESQEVVTHEKSSSVESVQSPPPSGHLKTPSVDSNCSAASSQNSKISNESAETQSISKRRRNRKKKFQAVKNLLIIKSFYASCSCTGVDRNHLVAAKAAN